MAPLYIAWVNSQHFIAPPVVYSLSEVWETSAEIPYWWHVMMHHYPDIFFHSICCSTVFSHQWLWNKSYKAILFQLFLDCFSLVFFEKDPPLHPRLNKFPGWIDCKATYKAKGAASTLKRRETWLETNTPLWLLIERIIKYIIIHNYSDWTYHFFHVCIKNFVSSSNWNELISVCKYIMRD